MPYAYPGDASFQAEASFQPESSFLRSQRMERTQRMHDSQRCRRVIHRVGLTCAAELRDAADRSSPPGTVASPSHRLMTWLLLSTLATTGCSRVASEQMATTPSASGATAGPQRSRSSLSARYENRTDWLSTPCADTGTADQFLGAKGPCLAVAEALSFTSVLAPAT